MDEFFQAFLGSYTEWILGLSFAVVAIKRRAIRKRHIARLLLAAVATFIAFFGLLLWGLSWQGDHMSATAFRFTLGILAAAFVVCSAMIGFSLILKSLGLASLDDADARDRVR